MAETASLRPLIADLLEVAAAGRYWDDDRESPWRLIAGAETLRWTHEYETEPTGDELLELERLRELVGDIGGWLDETRRVKGGYVKPMHPGTFVKRVAERLSDAS